MTETTTRAFEIGDTVVLPIDGHLTRGVVTELCGMDHIDADSIPGTGPLYWVRYDRHVGCLVHESGLAEQFRECPDCEGTGRLDRSEFMDLNSIEAVEAELLDSVRIPPFRSNWETPLEHRMNRIRRVARISFLASRLAWLETSRGSSPAIIGSSADTYEYTGRNAPISDAALKQVVDACEKEHPNAMQPGVPCPGCGCDRENVQDDEHGSLWLCANRECSFDK